MHLRLFIFFILPSFCYSQKFEWVRQSIPNSINDRVAHTLCDRVGNTFVSGTFQKSTTIAGTTLTTEGFGGSFLAKYNVSGTLVWIVTGTSSTDVYFSGIAIDEFSSVYFVATTSSSVLTIGSVSVNAGPQHNFLCRINKNGSVTMINDFVKGPLAYSAALAYNRGALFMHSTFGGNGAVVIGTNSFVPVGTTDILVAKFDTLGHPVWSHAFGGANEELASGIAVNPSNEVFICGLMNSPVLVMGTTTLTSKLRSGTSYLAKFDESGELVWAQKNTKGYIFNSSVAADHTGSVYFGGSFSDTLKVNENVLFSKSMAVFVMKIDGNGNSIWKTQTNSSDAYCTDLTCDRYGNSFFCGYVASGTVSLGSFSVVNTGTMTNNSILGVLDKNGQPLSLLSSGGNGEDIGTGIARDPYGNLFMIGSFNRVSSFLPNKQLIITFGSDTLAGTTANYFYLTKINGVKELVDETGTDPMLVYIYPNPATEELFVESQESNLLEVKLYDMSGNLVLSKKDLNASFVVISLVDLAQAIYSLHVTTTTGILFQKVVIK